MAATAITLLAPLAENLVAQAIAYEQARKAANAADAPTAAQIVANIEAVDAEIIQNADAQLGIKE